MSKISRSLFRKLSLEVIFLATPVFIISLGFFYLRSRNLIRQEAIERSKSILSTTIQRVDNYMGTIEASTNANAWLLEEQFTPDALETISQRIVGLNPLILSCSVSAYPNTLPQYGTHFSIYTTHQEDTIVSVVDTEFDYTDKVWYKEPINRGKACWVDPFSDYTEGVVNPNEAVATYCRPLRSDDGRLLGVVSTDLSFSQLAKTVISTEHPYPDAYFMLLGGDGRYLIHPDSTCLFRKTIFTDADPHKNADRIALGHQMIDKQQGTMHIKVNGKRCHVCYQPVPGTDWSLAMVCPDGEILKGYHRLAYVITALILIGLLIMIWLCHHVVRKTVQPIKKLLSITQQITDGNYDAVIPVSDQNDPISQLQNSFAAMQQSLYERMGSISKTAEEIRKQNERRAHEMDLAEESVRKKTQFIQNLSHQIRTPLNIILGFANVLHERISQRDAATTVNDPRQEEELSDITNMMKYNAIHLKRMILMLFDSSSSSGAESLIGNRKDEVSCNEVARESISYTYDHFPGLNIQFTSDLPDAAQILTNHLYLMRSIRELLYNAAKYSDGKHISLHISETETSVCFTIQDKGPGLSDNSEELIYKPFLKVDDLSEGLGLGLPLTKRHALSLGGDLIYDPTYTDGCRFTLEMPK